MRLLKKQRYSNTQFLNKIRASKNSSFNRNLLAFRHLASQNLDVNIGNINPAFVYPISGLKSSYVVNEKIDYQFIYECNQEDELQIFGNSVMNSNISNFENFQFVCNTNPIRWNITQDNSHLNGTGHFYEYYIHNDRQSSNRHSPDIKVPEYFHNYVRSDQKLIIKSQIRNLDGELDACIYTQLNQNHPKLQECLHYNDPEWHDFTVKIDTNGLSDTVHTVAIYAIQGSDFYRSNTIYNRFVVIRDNLDSSTCDPNYIGNNRLNSGSLMPSLLMGGLSYYFG